MNHSTLELEEEIQVFGRCAEQAEEGSGTAAVRRTGRAVRLALAPKLVDQFTCQSPDLFLQKRNLLGAEHRVEESTPLTMVITVDFEWDQFAFVIERPSAPTGAKDRGMPINREDVGQRVR
jgi:hypothetical protein